MSDESHVGPLPPSTRILRPISARNQSLVGMLRFPGPGSRPCLTVADASKWYELYVVYPGGRVGIVDFGMLDEIMNHPLYGSAYVDHVPNPIAAIIYANMNNFELIDKALEMMIGRWEHEVKGNYTEDHIKRLSVSSISEDRK